MQRRPAFLFTCLLTSFVALGASTLTAQSAATSAPRYEVQEIGSSAWGLTIPRDINNRGLIVGDWDSGDTFGDPRHAVVWLNGEMLDLTPDTAITSATARGVNDSGIVTGSYTTDGTYYAGGFRWQGGVFETLPTFAPGHQHGYGVSERGFIIGQSMHQIPWPFLTAPTVWDQGLNEFYIESLGEGNGSAHDSNGWDVVVGGGGVTLDQYNAFLWMDGELQDLGAFPGTNAGARAINNYNEVVGHSSKPFDDHAFYWTRETGMIDLGNLGIGYGASALDINDAGVIVGFSYDSSGIIGAVWHDFELFDLNSLLINGEGWKLHAAEGINELGQIVGYGKRDGVFVAYLATPVNTPMTTIIGPTPGRAGAMNTIEVIEGTPGAEIRVYLGEAAGESRIDGGTGGVVDIAAPRSLSLIADETGCATLQFYIPGDYLGKRLLFQAVDMSNCDVTNLIVRTVD